LLLERAKEKMKTARAISMEARAIAMICPKPKALLSDELWDVDSDIPKTESENEDESL
jgi:hypothetical protein